MPHKEFLRDRGADITRLVAASPDEKKRFLQDSVYGGAIPPQSADTLSALKSNLWDEMESKAAKIQARKRKQHEQASANEVPPAKKPKKDSSSKRWAHQPGRGTADKTVIKPGIALLNTSDRDGNFKEMLKRQGFVVMDMGIGHRGLVSFVQDSWRMSSRKTVEHLVVVAELAPGVTSAAALACRLVGGFLVEAKDILQVVQLGLLRAPSGIKFTSDIFKIERCVHVDSDIEAAFPGFLSVLRSAANVPGSKLSIASSVQDLQKAYSNYKVKRGARSKPWLHLRAVLPDAKLTPATHDRKKYPSLFCRVSQFVEFLTGSIDRDARCPGDLW